MKRSNTQKPASKAIRAKAKKLYDQGWTFSAISKEIGYDRRTIGKWSTEDHWRAISLVEEHAPEQKKTPKRASKAKKARKQLSLIPEVDEPIITPEKVQEPSKAKRMKSAAPRDNVATLEVVQAEPLDNLTMVCDALRCVTSSIKAADKEQDYRGLGVLATSLEKLINLRLKLEPSTISEVAKRSIELGYGPEEFVEELAKQWRLSA